MKTSPVLELTQKLIGMESVSKNSNAGISEYLHTQLENAGFTVERLDYHDENGVLKVNLVAKKGEGKGGLGFFSHTDTVPGQEQDWDAFTGTIVGERLYGRGSCDMKGPLAATFLAAADIPADQLKAPVYIALAADEETGLEGAEFVVKNSQLFRENVPAYGVIAEPTCMIPVYAHKGFYQVTVTAHGRAAHTSTGLGVSANLLIAPFLADMAELAKMSQADEKYLNHEFQPPTNGFNMVIDDGGTALNVTAAKTVARVGFRAMPNTPNEELMDMIVSSAEKYGLETVVDMHDSMYVDPGNKIIEVACAITGIEKAQTVPYGTEAIHYQRIIPNLIILGPGDISVAHTIEEFVPIAELEESVNVYRRMIEEFCM